MGKKFISLIIIAVVSMCFIGCEGMVEGDASTTTDTGDTISNNLTIAFVGKVVDPLGDPMSGVSIQLISDRTHNVTTDVNGNWLINVNLGTIVATPGGGGQETTDNDIETDPDEIARNFPIEISKSGFATYRYEAAFTATIGYTDGTGAVILLSKTGTVQPTTVLHPYVDNFEFTVYAGADPAPGAVVTLYRSVGPEVTDASVPGANTGSTAGSRYEVDQKRCVADENGVIQVIKDDKLPADGTYLAFAAPYDVLIDDTDEDDIPDEGDGIYEYDASVTTQPAGGFNLNVQDVVNANSLLHYEYDADEDTFEITQTEIAPSVLLQDAIDDIVVTYLSIQNVENIPIAQAADFDIMVMFNRPLNQELLAGTAGPLFRLAGANGTIPITVTNTGNYLFTITPDITLTSAYNTYSFSILDNEVAAPGGGTLNIAMSQSFNIYDPDVTAIAAITPSLNPGEDTSYKVDWNDALFGYPSVDNPYAKQNINGVLPLAWNVVDVDEDGHSEAADYEVWMKDSTTTYWQQVDPVNINFTYNDGLSIEATVTIAADSLFDAWQGEVNNVPDASVQPFFAGNLLQVVVMPVNINGFATDPNDDSTIAGLSLKDNWGPQIADPGWDTATNSFDDATTRYDEEQVIIAFDEPLANETLTTGLTGTYGVASANPANFTISEVRYADEDVIDTDDNEKTNSHIVLDLAPAVTTTLTATATNGDTEINVTAADMGSFAMGDILTIGDIDGGNITGFDVAAGTFTLAVNGDAASGSQVYWRGPIMNGYSTETYTRGTGTVDYGTLYVDDTSNFTTPCIISTPSKAQVTAVGANSLTVDPTAVDPCTSGEIVTGYNLTDTGVTVNAQPSDNSTIILTGSPASIEIGDLLVFDLSGDLLLGVVSSIASAPTYSLSPAVTGLTGLSGGDTVHEAGSAITTATTAGYPTVSISGVTTGIKPNSAITFTTTDVTPTTANVIGVYGDDLVVDKVFLDSNSNRVTGLGTITNDSSRGADSLHLNISDRSGNDSDATDVDGDGVANFDQIGYSEVGSAFGVF